MVSGVTTARKQHLGSTISEKVGSTRTGIIFMKR